VTHVRVPTWQDLAAGLGPDEAANRALQLLRDAVWLTNVGRASSRDGDVSRAGDWNAALAMFARSAAIDERTLLAFLPAAGVTGQHSGYSSNGTLNAPFWLLLERIDRAPALYRQTAHAANGALDTLGDGHYGAATDVASRIPVTAWTNPDPLLQEDPPLHAMTTLGDYMHEYIRLLFIEIYAGDVDEPRCTYFRDQLGWFAAGFLPCGWDGTWPVGRLRVF